MVVVTVEVAVIVSLKVEIDKVVDVIVWLTVAVAVIVWLTVAVAVTVWLNVEVDVEYFVAVLPQDAGQAEGQLSVRGLPIGQEKRHTNGCWRCWLRYWLPCGLT